MKKLLGLALVVMVLLGGITWGMVGIYDEAVGDRAIAQEPDATTLTITVTVTAAAPLYLVSVDTLAIDIDSGQRQEVMVQLASNRTSNVPFHLTSREAIPETVYGYTTYSPEQLIVQPGVTFLFPLQVKAFDTCPSGEYLLEIDFVPDAL